MLILEQLEKLNETLGQLLDIKRLNVHPSLPPSSCLLTDLAQANLDPIVDDSEESEDTEDESEEDGEETAEA